MSSFKPWQTYSQFKNVELENQRIAERLIDCYKDNQSFDDSENQALTNKNRLNKLLIRRKQLNDTSSQNQKLLQHIKRQKSSYEKRSFDIQYKQHQQNIKLIQKFRQSSLQQQQKSQAKTLSSTKFDQNRKYQIKSHKSYQSDSDQQTNQCNIKDQLLNEQKANLLEQNNRLKNINKLNKIIDIQHDKPKCRQLNQCKFIVKLPRKISQFNKHNENNFIFPFADIYESSDLNLYETQKLMNQHLKHKQSYKNVSQIR